MRILITGGNGCLGSNIVDYFAPKVEAIMVIDNFETSKKGANVFKENVNFIEGNIENYQLIQNTFDKFKPTHLIHCAASYKDPHNWQKDISVNINATINLVKIAEQYNIKKFINFQTSLCYGDPYVLPIPIDHYLNPKSSYAISKTAGELYLANSEINFVSFRLATVLAPRFVVGAVPIFYKRLSEGKNCFCSDTIRDFMGLDDFLKLLEISLEESSPIGVFNASTGEGVSMKLLHNTIAKIIGITNFEDPPIVPVGKDDIKEVVLDPSLTYKELGWKSTTSLEKDLEKLINWYQKSGIDSVYSHVIKPNIGNKNE
tara:strand:- start:2815 stop:3762 length:948 start_codon:yes stop_codon:yes gene_type:complete